MAIPDLILKEKPTVIDGEMKLRVPFEDPANPLTDENGAPKDSTVAGVYQLPEFIEYIDIPPDTTLDTNWLSDAVSLAYSQALPKAEKRAAAGDIKSALIPVIEDYVSSGLESKTVAMKVAEK